MTKYAVGNVLTWVKSRHWRVSASCPLYPRKQTWISREADIPRCGRDWCYSITMLRAVLSALWLRRVVPKDLDQLQEAHNGGPNREEWSGVDDHSRPTGSPQCNGSPKRGCVDGSLSRI